MGGDEKLAAHREVGSVILLKHVPSIAILNHYGQRVWLSLLSILLNHASFLEGFSSVNYRSCLGEGRGGKQPTLGGISYLRSAGGGGE